MPNYDFVCAPCGSSLELHRFYTDFSLPSCTKCGEPMVKILTPPAVHFKGNGWGGK